MTVATIGSALAEKRQELGLEKGQAADRIGMSRTTYSSYEQDAQRPSVDVFPALAEFLSISMEELLALYGATCIAAVRPSLERLLSEDLVESREAQVGEARSSDVSVIASSPFETSVEESEGDTDAEETTDEVLLELVEVANTQDVDAQEPLLPAASVASEDLSIEPSDSEESTNEVVLELLEARSQADTQDLEIAPLPDLEGVARSEQLEDFIEPPDVPTEEPDLPSSPHAASVGSVVFEPSPYFIQSSLSVPKKKKKKKKKKK